MILSTLIILDSLYVMMCVSNMSVEAKLGIILGIVVGINMFVFGVVFLYYTINIFKNTVNKIKKEIK